MNLGFVAPQRTYPTKWAVYRDGQKVNTLEGVTNKAKALKNATNLANEFPKSRWAIGAYRDDTGHAPMLVVNCLTQVDID